MKSSSERSLLEAFVAAYPGSKHVAEAKAMLGALKPAAPASPPAAAAPPATLSTSPTRDKLFERPLYGTEESMRRTPIDHCLTWGRDCGKPAADTFCRGQGFAGAKAFSTKAWTSTWLQGDQQFCSKPDCVSLVNVVCEGEVKPSPPPAEITIARPRINDVPVANCLYPSRSCGQKAAEGYCVNAGYVHARTFSGSLDGVRSIHMGDLSICEGPQCRALTNIVCTK